MTTLSVTNTFTSGTLARASEVNQNFTDIINWSSGSIDSTNITAGGVTTASLANGSVTNAKIDTNGITGANLLSGAAFFSLANIPAGAGLIPTINGGVPTGAILPYGAATAPSGYLLCDGSAVSRSTYATLFGVISTAFGVGDGATTFNVPDLRQRFPLGKAASGTGSTLGGTGGTIDHLHSGPAHAHTTTIIDGGNEEASAGGGSGLLGNLGEHEHTNSSSGTGDTGTANPPFQAVGYIIKI